MNFTEKSGCLRDTRNIALKISGLLSGDEVIFLNGGLGAGKTTLVRFLAEAFGCSQKVSSPTFTIMNSYHGDKDIFHFDLYRINSLEELEQTGFFEYMQSFGIKIIEWAEKFDLKEYFDDAIEINIVKDQKQRIISINSTF